MVKSLPPHFRRLVFLLAGILLASGFLPKDARAAIAYVQSANNFTTASVSTLSQAFNSNNTAGNFIIVWARWKITVNNLFTASVADSAGNAYQSLSSIVNTSDGLRGQIFYARNIAGRADTVTLTLSGSYHDIMGLAIHEYSGVDPVSPLDVEADDYGDSTQPSSTSTTNIAGDLLFGAAIANTDESSWTPDSGYTLRESNVRSGTEDQITTAAGQYRAQFTVPVTIGWISTIAAFKPAVAGLQVSSRSDTLSNSQPSATSNHTFTFTVNGAVSSSSTLLLALPGQFTFNPGITLVQSGNNGSAPATSITKSFDSNNTAGNLIVVSSGWQNSSITAAISDTEGNTYATAVGPIVNGTKVGQIWYAKNINAGANTVTVTYSSITTANVNIEIHEYSGADQTSPLDATSSKTGTSSLMDSGSATTTLANELIFGYGGNVVDMTGSGFTLRERTGSHQSEDEIAPSGGLYKVTFTNTHTPGSSWFALMATFKPASTSRALDCGDVDAATSVQFNFNYPSCAATATAWGFAADAAGSKITLQAPTVSTPNAYVATGTQITINIGSNATFQQQGAHWITNPSAAGNYTISVGGTFGGSGNMLVSINSGVTVQATVAESLALTVSSVKAVNCTADDGATVSAVDTSPTTVNFGTLSLNTFYAGCQDLVVSTNAGNGYSLTVQESSAMKTGDGRSTIPDTTCDGGTCTESAAAAWTNATKNGLGHTCFNQDGNHDCNTVYTNGTSGKNFRQFANIAVGETAQAIMSSSTPASVTARVKYRLSAGLAQVAGAYATVITYIITGTY